MPADDPADSSSSGSINGAALFEILLLSVGIYYGYLYFRGTRGAKVLTGLAIVFLTLTLISQLLNLTVIGWIIRSFSVFLAVALVVIFQPELRRGLAELGRAPDLFPHERKARDSARHRGGRDATCEQAIRRA